MSKEIEYNGALLKIDLYLSGNAHNDYDVEVIMGVAPSDEELIALCDGADPDMDPEDQLFTGGKVKQGNTSNKFSVRVFHD